MHSCNTPSRFPVDDDDPLTSAESGEKSVVVHAAGSFSRDPDFM
jgi:hypothetical protein